MNRLIADAQKLLQLSVEIGVNIGLEKAKKKRDIEAIKKDIIKAVVKTIENHFEIEKHNPIGFIQYGNNITETNEEEGLGYKK